MNFWLKKSILGLVLILLILVLFSYKDTLMVLADFGSSDAEQSTTEPVSTPEKPEPESKTTPAASNTSAAGTPQAKSPIKKTESINAAAEGLSNFYASIHGDFEKGDQPRIRRNVVYLPSPKGDLEKLLEDRKMVTRALPKNWRSDKESRPFREGQTLFQKLSEYADQEGLDVIWWLNRDLIVKHAFRINEDITRTAFQVGMAINGHTDNGVKTYFCHQHRAIVLVEEQMNDYLNKECQLLTSKSGF